MDKNRTKYALKAYLQIRNNFSDNKKSDILLEIILLQNLSYSFWVREINMLIWSFSQKKGFMNSHM